MSYNNYNPNMNYNQQPQQQVYQNQQQSPGFNQQNYHNNVYDPLIHNQPQPPQQPPPQPPQQPPPQPPQYQPHQQTQPNYQFQNNQNFNQNNNNHHNSSQTRSHSQYSSQSHSASFTRPPYVDPETNIAYACNDPEVKGWLTKQSQWLKDWRRRFFLLKGSKLFFCKNEYAAPHGMIDLATCTTVKSADLKSRKIHSFEISTPDMTYLLYADNEKEKDDWIGFVGRSIVRSSTTYLDKAADDGNGSGKNGGAWDNKEDDEVNYDELYEDESHPYFND